MVDHAELRRLAEVATPGPWRQDLKRNVFARDGINVALTGLPCEAAYIAAADPPTVLALLDAAERAERAIELLREVRLAPTYSPKWVRVDAFLEEVDRAE